MIIFILLYIKINFYRLYLYLKNKKDRSYIENSFKLKRLPDIDTLSIVRVKSNDRDTYVFLSDVSPQRLVKFAFGGNIKKNNNKLWEISYYANSLEVVLRATTKIVHFDNCSFSNTDLQTIIISASHISELEFYYCKFNIDREFILSGVYQPKLERLVFNYWWKNDLNYWVVNTEILDIIARAISISDFNDWLKEFKIIDEGWEEDDVRRILDLWGRYNRLKY